MVTPESYSLFLSISFLVGAAVGGISTIGGAIVGGFFIQFVPNFANDISDAAPWAIYGLAMLVCMYTMPNGLVGALNGDAFQQLQAFCRTATEDVMMKTPPSGF